MGFDLRRYAQGVALAVCAVLGATETAAQSGPAFPCDGSIYQVQSGQLRIFDPITSSYLNVGPQQSSYNATGFNVSDNYAYASQGNSIIRLYADGSIEQLYTIGFSSFSGDVDRANNFYLRRTNDRYVKFDLANGRPTNIDFTGVSGGPADVAYDEFGNEEYLIGFNGRYLYRYNITTRIKTRVTVPDLPSGAFGATWVDSTGRLFTFNNNNGLLYEAFDYYTNSPTLVQVGVGVPSGNNDGFSCSSQPFPNLAPVAFDDDFTTPLNTQVISNVIPDNGNGLDNDPDGGPITVNTTPVAGPTNGMVTLQSDGSFTYTPDPNFIGIDKFEYQIIDQANLTATAVVTITVTGTIDYTVVKTQVSGPSPATAAGDVLGYQIVVTNTGDIPLTNVVTTDTFPDGTNGAVGAPVEAGATSNTPGQLDLNETWTYTLSYTVGQDEIDAGIELINTAAVAVDEVSQPKTSTAITNVAPTNSFSLSKSVDVGTLSAAGLLTYTITVDNTGTSTLTGVSLTDVLTQGANGLTLTAGPTLSGDANNNNALDVTEVWVYTASFAAGQDQLDDGADIVNTATVDTDQTGLQSADAITTIAQTPGLSVAKTSDTGSLSAPGLITYSIDVTNTGNISLTGVTPTDTLTQGASVLALTSGLTLSGDTDADGALDPTETWTYTGTYAADQAAINDGTDIVNAVSVASNEAPTDTAQTTTTISQTPAFSIAKSVDTASLTAPGTLNYEVVVTNTGNIDLTGNSFTDTLAQGAGAPALTTGPTLSGDVDNDGNLSVGEVWVYTASYAALQAQIDDGNDIVNTALFTPAEVSGQSAIATTTIGQIDALTLSKAIAAGQPRSFSAVGDTIAFAYTVTNTGNTTLQGPITIDDDQIGNGLACWPTDLLPGQSETCQLTWTADQTDLNAGDVTNIATAEDAAGTTSAPQSETVSAVQSPALSINKEIIAPVPASLLDGETLFYEYTVVNTGNVTLTDLITVSDNLVNPNPTCPALPVGGLVPQGSDPVGPTNSIVCSGSYVISTVDEQLGSVTNTAIAQTTFGTEPVVSPTDFAVFPVFASPVLDLQKTALPLPSPITAVGDLITYEYRIENIPPLAPAVGAPLTEDILINDDKFAAPILCYDASVEGSSFDPGEVHTCQAVYAVTQDDLDAGQVDNEATANTIFAPLSPDAVDVTSAPANESVPVAVDPELSVVKTVTGGPSPAEVGDTVTYQIVASNTGNQTLSNVAISDPLLGALTCGTPMPVTLAPAASLTCTGSYTVLLSDIDDQIVGGPAVLTNVATASGSDPSGTPLPPFTGEVGHPLDPAAPAVSVAKALFPNPALNPAYSAVGDLVRFRVTVTNSGNMTLDSIDVTDNLVPGTCTVGPLAPGATDQTCVFDYTIQQADLDAGQVLNMATASAQPADPTADPVTDDGSATATGAPIMGTMALVKSGALNLGADGVANVGDRINYTVTVTNTGLTTLRDIAITDPGADTGSITYAAADDADSDNDIDSLAPGASVVVTAVHTLDQNDINAGSFANTATGNGFDAAGNPVADTSDSSDPNAGPGGSDPTVTPIPRGTGLAIVKTPSATAGLTAGDTISYTYAVTNTGNTTLSNVTLTDAHTTATATTNLPISGNVIATLLPGQTVNRSATYVVTQDDIDAGVALTNTVSATSTSPGGTTPPTASDTASVTPEAAVPGIEVLKTVRSQTGSMPGDVVTFELTVSNTGNVTLSTPVLTETLRRNDFSLVTPPPTPIFESGDTAGPGDLDVGETWVYRIPYTLTQADIDAAGIRNSVVATATDPANTSVTDTSDNGAGTGSSPTVVVISPTPGIQTVKTVRTPATTVGGTVTYAIEVENIGNVTLTGVSISSDTLTDLSGAPLSLATGPTFAGADAFSTEGTLIVGETATYLATYVLTQSDIDAGGLRNTATAQGFPPAGGGISDVSDASGVGSTPTDLIIPAAPLITFDKRLAPGSGPNFDSIGDVLNFQFEITNAGNVTLSGPYSVADPMITAAGGTISCPATGIAPGASVICTGSYAVDQDDLDAGQVLNSATATVPGAPPVVDSVTVPGTQMPALSMVKSAPSIDPVDFVVGLPVTYTLTTTNTGNVTITAPITISDTLIMPGDISCPAFPANGIAPGGTYVCTGDYIVTSDDVALANVTNNATASAGPVTSPIATVTIPNNGTPALSIVKDLIAAYEPGGAPAAALTFDEVGDQLEYEFRVTNTGQVSFANPVTVTDLLIPGPITCFTPTLADPDLTPGETATCTGIYVVQQSDLDAGEVLNEATAETTFGSIPTTVLSQPATETTVAASDPALSLVKSVLPTTYSNLGQTVTFSFDVVNTGNQTLNNVVVTDPQIPSLSCDIASLPVGGSLSCTAPYLITQADLDAGSLTNVASVNGLDPSGTPVPQTPATTDSVTMAGPSVAPTLALRKLANPSPFGALGSSLTYTFEVTNTSIYTMSGITVTDPLPGQFIPYTCNVGTLAPGAVSTTCQLVTTVTQDLLDAGQAVNTASVSGTDPFGNTATDSDTATTAGPAENPQIVATKLVNVPSTTLGQVIDYTLLVENPGNVSLNLVLVTDQMQRNDGTPLTLDNPLTQISGDTNFDGLLTPGEVWTFTASYTIQQDDIDAGGFSNVATAQGTSPTGTVVRDVADDGDDTDGNTTDDPTVVSILTTPVLDATKVIRTTGAVDGDPIVFLIRAANTGNVSIFNASVTDTLTRADGTDLSAAASAPVRVSNADDDGDAILAPGEAWTWEVTYTLTQDDIDAGGLSNVAVVSGTDIGGVPVTDVADNDDPTDGNITDDPTVLTIAPAPGLDVTKTVASNGAIPGTDVVFEIAVVNTGNVTLSGISFTDDMTNLDGDILTPAITVTGLTVGGDLAAGTTAIYTATHTLTQADIDAGGVSNTALFEAMSPLGVPLSDRSDDGDDTDGNTVDDPTIAPIAVMPSMVVVKEASTPERIAPDTYAVSFEISITNDGNVSLTDLSVQDDLTPFLSPATLASLDAPVVSGFDVGTLNASYDGITDVELLETGSILLPGSTGTILLSMTYDTSTGQPGGRNSVSVTSNGIEAPQVAGVTVTASDDPSIFATKSASVTTARLGDTISYTLTFQNQLATIESNLTLIDLLPAGIVYTPGTTARDGVSIDDPLIIGRTLRWASVTIDGDATAVYTFDARLATGAPGSYINSAYATDADGKLVSNIATAEIVRRPEPVFDCADIIGKVFDDRNQNGYQDGVPDPSAAITDQDIFDDKFGGKLTEPALGPEGEPGLPGVRLATVNGTLITTDEHGRFSVPCAELPADIGSNFQLKLDTRTLPTGYHLTTENPRNVRVTAGRMTRLNFGATLSNLVEVDLTAAAFVNGGTAPGAALTGWLDTLIAQMEATPSTLRLTYYRASEDQSTANARLDALEALIRDRWQQRSRYRLTVERTIHRTQ